MKTFTSTIEIIIGGNELEASTKTRYIEKLKEMIKEQYNIELYDDEIKDIKEVK